jgi:hypothetical protein
VAEANREADKHNDQRTRHQRLDTSQTNRAVLCET